MTRPCEEGGGERGVRRGRGVGEGVDPTPYILNPKP